MPVSNIFIDNCEIKYNEEADNVRKIREALLKARQLIDKYQNIRKEEPKTEKEPLLVQEKQSVNEKSAAVAHQAEPSVFVNMLNANSSLTSVGASARANNVNVNALNANATGAVASLSANANNVNVNTLNANATGAVATASANANAVNANLLNANATGVRASVSANASAAELSAGNVNVTGIDVSAGVNVTGVKAAFGNVNVTGAGAGAHVNVTGASVNAFNVNVGGPRAGVQVNVSGPSLSFGNIDIGLTPTLNVGLGLNFDLAIPFLSSGGGGGGDGENGANAKAEDKTQAGSEVQNGGASESEGTRSNGAEPNGEVGSCNAEAGSSNAETVSSNGGTQSDSQSTPSLADRLLDRFPNRSYLITTDGIVSKETYLSKNRVITVDKNTSREPTLSDNSDTPGQEAGSSQSRPGDDGAANGDPQGTNVSQKFVGLRGTASVRNAEIMREAEEIRKTMPEEVVRAHEARVKDENTWIDYPSLPEDQNKILKADFSCQRMYGKSGGSFDPRWAGTYTSDDLSVAEAYTVAEDYTRQPINQAFVDKDTNIYYTREPLSYTNEAGKNTVSATANTLLDHVRETTGGNYVFGGHQSREPDGELSANEFVTRLPNQSDIKLVEWNPANQQTEANRNQVIPDYYINMRHIDPTQPTIFDQNLNTTHNYNWLNNVSSNESRKSSQKPADAKKQIEEEALLSELKNRNIDPQKFCYAMSQSAGGNGVMGARHSDPDDDDPDLKLAKELSLQTDDDQDLKRAIELSLMNDDNQDLKQSKESSSQTNGDQDLKRAIELSLMKVDESKPRNDQPDESDSDVAEEEEEKPKCNHSRNVTCFNCLSNTSGRRIKPLTKNGNIFGFADSK